MWVIIGQAWIWNEIELACSFHVIIACFDELWWNFKNWFLALPNWTSNTKNHKSGMTHIKHFRLQTQWDLVWMTFVDPWHFINQWNKLSQVKLGLTWSPFRNTSWWFCTISLCSQHAPVVARAAMFLECCHFVHRCNYGEWPDWMRFNVRGTRGRGMSNAFGLRATPSVYRKHASLQRTAAKMFYMWAEVWPCWQNTCSIGAPVFGRKQDWAPQSITEKPMEVYYIWISYI